MKAAGDGDVVMGDDADKVCVLLHSDRAMTAV
jgi:hypothetical protein